MAIGDKTYPWARRFSAGSIRLKALYNNTFGYTENKKEVGAADADIVLAATNGATTVTTVTTGITDPDVPRALSVTPGGTAADILDSHVTVTGVNVEGKTISEMFRTANGDTTIINGNLAFKRVTQVVIGQMGGSGATFSVGTRNALGVNHRLFRNNTTVKVYSYTAPGEPGGMPANLTLQAAPTVVANESEVERNLVTPATAPDGTTAYTIAYAFDNWAVAPLQDQPEYSTTISH